MFRNAHLFLSSASVTQQGRRLGPLKRYTLDFITECGAFGESLCYFSAAADSSEASARLSSIVSLDVNVSALPFRLHASGAGAQTNIPNDWHTNYRFKFSLEVRHGCATMR